MACFNEKNYQVLISCIKQGANNEARAHLQKLDNFRDFADDLRLTLLHHSVLHGNVNMVKHLIELGCDVNVGDKYGNTPIILATLNENVKIIEALLNKNADIHHTNFAGISSFQIAAQNRLCNSKFDYSQCKMHYVFDMFIDETNRNFRTNERVVSLSLVNAHELVKLSFVVFGNVTLANFLLKNGYAIDYCETKNNSTALHWAVYLAKQKVIKMLIKYGANVNSLDAKEHSPLYYYTKNLERADRQSEVLKTLIKASLTFSNQHGVIDARHGIENLLKKGKKRTVRTVLKSGIDVNALIFSDGRTLLHVLIENENDDVFGLLTELNIEFDVNARTESQKTALMTAAYYGFLRKVEFLLKHGANVNLMADTGESAIFFACKYYEYKENEMQTLVTLFELLLQHGAKVESIVLKETILDRIEFSERKQSLAKVIMAHLTLQEAFDHSSLTDLIRENIEMEPIYKTQYDFCVKEIEQMKHIEVHKKVSLFQLLAEKGEKKMLYYARDEAFVSALYCAIKKIPSESYYFKILEERIRKVAYKIKLNKKAASVLDALTGLCCDVYHHIVYQIISYLADQDLNNLYGAGSVVI